MPSASAQLRAECICTRVPSDTHDTVSQYRAAGYHACEWQAIPCCPMLDLQRHIRSHPSRSKHTSFKDQVALPLPPSTTSRSPTRVALHMDAS